MTTNPLLAPVTLGSLTCVHRVMMAPLTRCRAGPADVPTPLMAHYYAQRSGRDGASLIVSEATQISLQGRGYPHTPGIHTPEQVAGWRLITDAVHQRGGLIVCQLWHVGRISHPDFQPGNAAPVAPSAVTPPGNKRVYGNVMKPYVAPRPLEAAEIPRIIADYAHAARCAKDAGFDGVEVHGANGYLLDQFLRDGTNHRTDDWGGPIKNRARLHLEVTRACCEVFGSSRVGIRLSPSGGAGDRHDSDPHATFGYLAEQLDTLGLSFVHILRALEGDSESGSKEVPLSFFRPLLSRTPLIANGRYSPAEAQREIASGGADAIAFGRLFISNPDLAARIAADAPTAPWDSKTFYAAPGVPLERGYTDYPGLTSDLPSAQGARP